MYEADIGIVGGGLGGSVAAAMLGRAGFSVVLIDAHHPYPEDFRCEKIEEKHFKLLRQTGFMDEIIAAADLFDELWIARYGHVINKRPNEQYGLAYTDFVNVVRNQIPESVRFILGRADKIWNSPNLQTIIMRDGEEISVRLIVLASGSNNNTSREQVNISRHVTSQCHAISVGFSLKPAGPDKFDFIALTYYGETPKDRIAYLSFFPLRGMMRVNIFLYRDIRDPWLTALRETPQAILFAALPRLKRVLGDFDVVGEMVIRPIDLYHTSGYRQPGVVLAGDAFSTASPAAGTGVVKVLNDVVMLCNHHIPHWIKTPGMGVEKISEYYGDSQKITYDAYSDHLAHYIHEVTLSYGIRWRVTRAGWFGLAVKDGVMNSLRRFIRHSELPEKIVANPSAHEIL